MVDPSVGILKLRFSNSGSEFESATTDKVDNRYDLITFLGVAQQLGVDFLPITWQPALDYMGRGATAEIREAAMTLQASFAFKRPLCRFKKLDFRMLSSLIAEISILGHPSIRQHSNIVQLEGISWDVFWGDGETDSRQESVSFTKEGGLVPVLVFEKTNHGDLSRFMTTDKGKQLGFAERLNMCASIASAVAAMHSSNIIHGDIKPQNVLVFDGASGAYTLKVADFGYSTQYASPNEEIYMPISRPWAAPEWHHRGFMPAQAARMDTYSFGMLALWLLSFSTEIDSYRKFVTELNAASEALALAYQKVPTAYQNQKIDLIRFFRVTLAENVSDRCPDFRYLQCLLVPEMNASDRHTVRISNCLDPTSVKFHLVPSIYQFYSNDYRIRSYVAGGLFRRMQNTENRGNNKLVPHDILLQCAFCYELGFGTTRDAKRSRELLDNCEECQAEFHRQLGLLRSGKYPLQFREGLYRKLNRHGQLQTVDLSQSYRGQESLENVEREYRREIVDVESALGNDHGIVTILKNQLVSILFEHGQYEEAEELALQIVETSERTLGNKHPDTLTSISNLAPLYSIQERYEEAKGMQMQVIKEMQSMLGEGHPNTMCSIANLANIYKDEGLWKQAEELQKQVVQTSIGVFGQEHPRTLTFMADLAVIYKSQGCWDEAEKLITRVINASKRVEGDEHPHTLHTIGHLIGIYRAQGRWKEAEELDLKTQELSHRVFEQKDPATVIGPANLLGVYMRQKRWKDAEEIQMQIIERMRKASGEQDVDTLGSIAMLASMYKHQKRWKEAENLDVFIVEMQKKTLGEDHPETLLSMMNLAATYRDQRLLREAEQLDLQILDISKRALGDEHEETLTAMSNLAVTYYYQRRSQEAMDLEIQILEIRKRALGEEHEDTLTTMSNLAKTYWANDWRQEAMELELQLMLTMKRARGADDPTTLASMANMAHIYHYEGRRSEAIELMTEVARLEKVEKVGDDDEADAVRAEDALKEWLEEASAPS